MPVHIYSHPDIAVYIHGSYSYSQLSAILKAIFLYKELSDYITVKLLTGFCLKPNTYISIWVANHLTNLANLSQRHIWFSLTCRQFYTSLLNRD